MSSFSPMLGGIWQSIIDFATGIFALIPQFLYFIYTCCASFLDLLQFLVRKLAGLDTYFVNGHPKSGDIVSDFISGVLGINGDVKYSALSTVFWSLFIFGCILLILTTIFAIIKAHYSYDASKSNPMKIIGKSLKSFCYMLIVPVVTIFGIYIGNILLQVMDDITSPASELQVVDVFKNSSGDFSTCFEKGSTPSGGSSYASYDFFGGTSYTESAVFSGVMFKICAKNANRVREGSYTASTSSSMGQKKFLWTDFGIFTSTASDAGVRKEEVADMIDFAFANCLTLKDQTNNASLLGAESSVLISSFTYFESAVWYLGCINVHCFSKYNIGLVWYYYNLWSFNFFLGYAGMIACLTVFTSVVFGLIVRLIKALALFLVYPTLVGISPLDDNGAVKKWNKEFLATITMSYGAVVGLNLAFLLLKEFQKISFFRATILNDIMDMALIIVLLAVIKDIVKFLSGMIGGADAIATGKDAKDKAKEVGTKTVETGLKAAKLAAKLAPATPIGVAANAINKAKEAKDKLAASQDGRAGLMQDRAGLIQERDGLNQQADEELEQSQALTGEAADFFNENRDNIDSPDFDENAEKFADEKGGDAFREAFSSFKSKYDDEAKKIDSDGSLSDKEKKAKKSQLYNNLARSALSEFNENNEHAVAGKTLQAQALEKDDQIKEKDKQIKEIENMKKPPKRPKSPYLKAALDIGGQTLKLLGRATGVFDGWETLKKNSSAGDDLNEARQQVFQTFHVKSQLDKIKDGSSKYLTSKQKAKKEKDAAADYRKNLSDYRFNSQRAVAEMKNFIREIKKNNEV